MLPFARVSIVGLGLIGSSIARAVREAMPTVRVTGRTDVPHSWSYLPDVGRALAMLADAPAGRVHHLPVGPPCTQQELADAFARAAKLPRIALEDPRTAIGKNTVHALQSGLVFGYAEMVDGLLRRIRAELQGQAQ